MKARLGGLFDGLRGARVPQPWRPGEPYPPLAELDVTPLVRQAGIYALWHLGVRPRWLRVGGAPDLGAVLAFAKDNTAIRAAGAHDGVYVAWAFQPVTGIPGTVAFLAAALQPYLQAVKIPGEIAPATTATTAFPLPPGTTVPPAH